MKNENIVIKKDCHSRGMLSGIYNACRYYTREQTLLNKCVEDPRLRLSGMTPNLMAFTLIELLVVVLIIGILAAVAVPQYQKSVEKSRATEALTNLRAIAKAQQVYRLANGKMAATFDELDIDISGEKEGSELKTKFFTYTLSGLITSTNNVEISARRLDNNVNWRKYSIYVAYTGGVLCVAKTEASKPICQHITGTNYNMPNLDAGYYYYPFDINFYNK